MRYFAFWKSIAYNLARNIMDKIITCRVKGTKYHDFALTSTMIFVLVFKAHPCFEHP